MKLIDPLQGFQVVQGPAIIQCCLAFTLGFLLAKGEVHYADAESSIGVLLIGHITCAVLQLFMIFISKIFKFSQIRPIIFTSNLMAATIHQLCIIYAQLMFLTSKVEGGGEICGEQNAYNWLTLEITYYYSQLLGTIFFLFFHSIKKLKVMIKEEDYIENIEQEYEHNEDGDKFQIRMLSFDFLALINDKVVVFQLFTSTFVISCISIVYDRVENEASEIFIPMIIVSSFLLIGTFMLIHYYYADNRIDVKFDNKIVFVLSIPIISCLFASFVIQCTSTNDYTLTPSILRQAFILIMAIAPSLFMFMVIILIARGCKNRIDSRQQSDAQVTEQVNEKVVDDDTEKKQQTTQAAISNQGNNGNPPNQPDKNDESEVNYKRIEVVQDHLNKLQFSEDFYAIAYLAYYYLYKKKQQNSTRLIQSNPLTLREKLLINLKTNFNRQEDQQEQLQDQESLDPLVTSFDASKNFSTCFFIWMIQLGLIILVFQQFTSESYAVATSTYSVLLVRILCGILLHIQLEGETRQSLMMFNYARCNVQDSSYKYPMLFISCMQFTGAAFTEILNILLICAQDNVQDVIMNFIALGVIAEIDDFYANSLYNSDVKESIPNTILVINEEDYARESIDVKFKPATWLYNVIIRLYQCYYYYFMPYTVIAISYFFRL